MGKKFTTVDAKERLELAKICIDEINDEVDMMKEALDVVIKCGYYEIEDKEAGRNEGPNCCSFEDLFTGIVIDGGLHKISVDYYIERFRDIIEGKIDEGYKKHLLYRMSRKNKKDE